MVWVKMNTTNENDIIRIIAFLDDNLSFTISWKTIQLQFCRFRASAAWLAKRSQLVSDVYVNMIDTFRWRCEFFVGVHRSAADPGGVAARAPY
jgi:hypothetical protein